MGFPSEPPTVHANLITFVDPCHCFLATRQNSWNVVCSCSVVVACSTDDIDAVVDDVATGVHNNASVVMCLENAIFL